MYYPENPTLHSPIPIIPLIRNIQRNHSRSHISTGRVTKQLPGESVPMRKKISLPNLPSCRSPWRVWRSWVPNLLEKKTIRWVTKNSHAYSQSQDFRALSREAGDQDFPSSGPRGWRSRVSELSTKSDEWRNSTTPRVKTLWALGRMREVSKHMIKKDSVLRATGIKPEDIL